MARLASLHLRDERAELAASEPRVRARGFRLTVRDRELLRFIAGHPFVLACHVQELLGVDRAVAYRRLSGLINAGLLAHRRIFHAEPGVFQITPGGLGLIDSSLREPRLDLRSYRHDVGVGWLWLMARAGRFGSAEAVVSERELRGGYERARARRLDPLDPDPVLGEPAGLTVDLDATAARQQLHHPDILVCRPGGRRVALELELSLKSRARLERILLAYSLAPELEQVVYLTDSRAVSRALTAAVEAFALDGLVWVRYLEPVAGAPWWYWRSLRSGGWKS